MKFQYGPFSASIEIADGVPIEAALCRHIVAGTGDPSRVVRLEPPAVDSGMSRQEPRFSTGALKEIRIREPDWTADVTLERALVRISRTENTDYAFVNYFLASVGLAWTILNDGIVLHASSVATGDGALLFAGKSGVGKTTVANAVGGEAILDDDQTMVVKLNRKWRCTRPRPDKARLVQPRKLFLLERARRTEAVRLRPSEALPLLMKNVVLWPAGPAVHRTVLAITSDLVESIPCYLLRFALHDVSMEALEEAP